MCLLTLDKYLTFIWLNDDTVILDWSGIFSCSSEIIYEINIGELFENNIPAFE